MPSPTRGKLQKILALELEFQPSEEMTQKVLDFLKANAVNKAAPELKGLSQIYARAVGLFELSLDKEIGDVHIDPDLEHEVRMEPVKEMRELAQRMAEVLESPHLKTTGLTHDRLTESVKDILRELSIVEAGRDRRLYFRSKEKQEGDPKRARFELYIHLSCCWCACKQIDVPARSSLGGGPFEDFAEGLLALAPYTEHHVSADEMHKYLLKNIKRRA